MDIGSRLKALRTERGLTQAEIASALHVSRQTIISWEQGKTTPDAQSLLMLSTLYNLPVDTLMRGDIQTVQTALSKQRNLSHAGWTMASGIGLLGTTAVLAMASNDLAPMQLYATAATPLLFSMLGAAVMYKHTKPQAALPIVHSMLGYPDEFDMACTGRREELSARITSSEGTLFCIERILRAFRRAQWRASDNNGRSLARITLRLITAGVQQPAIEADIEGLGRVILEKKLELREGYQYVWHISGSGIGIKGDWLGDVLKLTRDNETVATISTTTTATTNDTQPDSVTYHVSLTSDLLAGAIAPLTFMIALMRDYERSLIA